MEYDDINDKKDNNENIVENKKDNKQSIKKVKEEKNVKQIEDENKIRINNIQEKL